MDLLEMDRKFVWHPFSPLRSSVVPIVGGEGAFLIREDGGRIFDGISSWWVNLHGHNHPYIREKINNQLHRLDHVIFAGFTHPGAVELAYRLIQLWPSGNGTVFYSDNGSTSVEVALKMSLQYWHNRKRPRKKFLSFKGAYHGDTFGAMAVGERGSFTRPFAQHLFETLYIDPPLRGDSGKKSLEQMKEALKDDDIAAFIFEPLVQGTAGMVMQDAEALLTLVKMAKSKGVLTIADEVMTGFGRTGKIFAMDHLEGEEVDFLCLAKGLTGGTLPLGATLCHEKVVEAFKGDTLGDHTFFHGHSYTANPVAVAAGLASLDLLLEESGQQNRARIEASHLEFQREMQEDPYYSTALKDVRVQGTILALEFRTREGEGYFHPLREVFYPYFMERDILLRPLGNVLYLIPPYCTDVATMQRTYDCIKGLWREQEKWK